MDLNPRSHMTLDLRLKVTSQLQKGPKRLGFRRLEAELLQFKLFGII